MKEKIQIAYAAGRNEIFKWYIDHVSKIFLAQCHKESQNKDTQAKIGNFAKFPMLNYLIYIVRTHDIINETDEDKYTFSVWLDALLWLKQNCDQMKESL